MTESCLYTYLLPITHLMLDNKCFVNWAELIRTFPSGLNKKKKLKKKSREKHSDGALSLTLCHAVLVLSVYLFVCSVYASDISVQ